MISTGNHAKYEGGRVPGPLRAEAFIGSLSDGKRCHGVMDSKWEYFLQLQLKLRLLVMWLKQCHKPSPSHHHK